MTFSSYPVCHKELRETRGTGAVGERDLPAGRILYDYDLPAAGRTPRDFVIHYVVCSSQLRQTLVRFHNQEKMFHSDHYCFHPNNKKRLVEKIQK